MDPRVKAVIDLVHTSPTLRRGKIDRLARHVDLSSTRLRQLFKTETGSSPLGYLKKTIMERAARMLRDTRLSVKEIAFECGATDVSHFVRDFKRKYGETPTEFRRGLARRSSVQRQPSEFANK